MQIFFGAGVAAYLLKNRGWREVMPIAICSLMLAYGRYYDAIDFDVKFASLAFAVGAAAFIVVLIDIERLGWKVPRIFVIIGNASFSLYLWHWLVIPLASRWKDIGGAPELWRWIIVIISTIFAIASYYFVERPLILFSHRRWYHSKLNVIGDRGM